MTWNRDTAMRVVSQTFLSAAVLAEQGMTRRQVAARVASGALVRLRRGRFAAADTHPRLVEAARLGGRLDCVSLLVAMGIFIRAGERLHVQFDPATTRLPPRGASTRAHWRPTKSAPADMAADLIEALAQACRCQSPRDAIATLDSAWHLEIVDEEAIAAIFARLPLRYQSLRNLLDRRSEAGPETLMRLLLRGLGCHVEVQVDLDGVGRVDLIVDGWLIVECDSKAFHEGWKAQKRDRRRDLAAASLGYTTIRPLAEDIMYQHDDTLALMKSVLAHRPVHNSTRSSSRRAGTRVTAVAGR